MTATLSNVVDALARANCKPTKAGNNSYTAYCPVHEADSHNHKPSLSVAAGDKVDVVLNCHAGCSHADILKVLGIEANRAGADRRSAGTSKRIVAAYTYQDASGKPIFEKVRYKPKDFRIRHRDANGAEVWKLPPGIEPPLYRLPDVLAAITDGEPVYYVEGCKDADRLAAAGLCATTNFEGAAKDTQKPKWRDSYTAALTGADVMLLPDNDEPGKAHMRHIAAALAGKALVRWLELPGLPAKGDVSDWLDQGHTVDELKVLAANARHQDATSGTTAGSDLDTDAYRGTDDANAALFLGLHGQDVRFCPPWDKWLLWTGSHWRMDDRLDIHRLAADVPRLLYRAAGEAADSAQRRAIADLARKLEGTAKQANMLTAVRHRVVVHHSDLDNGYFLLNASNGTLDLTTGRLREHARADLLTHDTEILYKPNATAPTWLRFLHDVFAGDADLIRFVQRAMGYSLTGDVREQVLLICHGIGSNGKSVFLNVLRALLRKLALQAAPDLLMADKQRRHPTEQADLFGRRCVVCQETGEGRRFNETLVKQLTGGDAIRARRMHEDFWEFAPTHKLWLSTNHRPEIRGTDYAIWRRIRLIPFNVVFTDDGNPRKDPTMEARLMAELPGILAWAVCGCLDWQKHGLGMAEAVKTATTGYQADMDVLAAWLADCCILGKRYEAKASDLYASYSDWCAASGETAEPQRKWGMRLTERGFTRQRRMVGIFWLGIGLKVPDHEPYEPYEPEKAVFPRETSSARKIAKSGSYGSYPTYAVEAQPS